IIIIPGLAFGALFLAPFLDNGPGRRPPKRPIAVAMMILALASVVWLTYESATEVDWETRAETNKPIHPDAFTIDTDDPGYEHYKNSCAMCHGDNLEGLSGPSLLDIDYDADEIARISVEGIGDMPADAFTGTDEELEQLVEFILSVNEQNEE